MRIRIIGMICAGIISVAGTTAASGQEAPTPDSAAAAGEYHFELQLIGGYGRTRYEQQPSIHDAKKDHSGWNVNLRFMWHPDHLLSMGLMSGYQVFSRETLNYFPYDQTTGTIDSSTTREVTMELSSVPIHLAFEMRPLHIRIGAGLGVYLLQSQLIENDSITHSSDVSFGGSAWVGYEFDLTKHLHIGPDIVIQLLSDRGIRNISAMLVLRYDLLSY